MYKSKMNNLSNAMICNIIQTLIYKKYQRRIYHVCIILLTSRYLSHSNQPINV
uniref:Uncharacterized protein n=1 Tax=Helianthus annuus TaxID=4232 RepID=A0A251RYW2_HELAN